MFGSLLRPRASRQPHGIRTITVVAPLADDAVTAIEGRLEQLGDGDSPFAASERTHFARLVVLHPERPRFERPRGMRPNAWVIDAVTHLGRQQREDPLSRPYLLFSAGYDDDPAADPYRPDHSSYVEHLRVRLEARADEIWGDCDGYPGWSDAEAFGAFVTGRTTPAAYIFAPPETATVEHVQAALARRAQVIDAAVATQGVTDDAELRSRVAECMGARTTRGGSAGRPVVPEGRDDEAAEWNDARRDALRYPSLPRARALTTKDLDLADVQGLPVGYPTHDEATFVFLRVTEPAAARSWLARTPVTTASEANQVLAGKRRIDVARHVAVSHHGLMALGLDEEQLVGFDRVFRSGMARREHSLAPQVGLASWQQPYQPEPGHQSAIDVLVHLSSPEPDLLNAALEDLRGELAASGGFVEVAQEVGHLMLDDTGVDVDGRPRYLEHFGFADGGSQPEFSGVRSRRGRTVDGAPPDVLPTGELLLGYEDIDGDAAGATAPPELARNGCYLVFRKLEQDVPAFHALAEPDRQAKLVGRRPNGAALTIGGGPRGQFHFRTDDADGFECPIGAHVRRVNPRDSRPLLVGAPPDGEHGEPVEPRLTRRHRMLRRGIPYGKKFPADGERGLLFVALVGDLGRQYEFVQTQWMNTGQAFRLGGDPDVFSGIAGEGHKATLQGRPPAFVGLPRSVVTCRGGEYFLLPGVAALRRLGTVL